MRLREVKSRLRWDYGRLNRGRPGYVEDTSRLRQGCVEVTLGCAKNYMKPVEGNKRQVQGYSIIQSSQLIT